MPRIPGPDGCPSPARTGGDQQVGDQGEAGGDQAQADDDQGDAKISSPAPWWANEKSPKPTVAMVSTEK